MPTGGGQSRGEVISDYTVVQWFSNDRSGQCIMLIGHVGSVRDKALKKLAIDGTHEGQAHAIGGAGL